MTVLMSSRSACATRYCAIAQPRILFVRADRPDEDVDRPALVVGRPRHVPGRDAAGREAAEGRVVEDLVDLAADHVGAVVRPDAVSRVAAASGVPPSRQLKACGELPVSAEASTRASASWSAYASGKPERCTACAATVIRIAS